VCRDGRRGDDAGIVLAVSEDNIVGTKPYLTKPNLTKHTNNIVGAKPTLTKPTLTKYTRTDEDNSAGTTQK
jgi:hypothetical protein